MSRYLSLDGIEEVTFEAAAVLSKTWNGWEIPRFTREQADKVAAWFESHEGFDGPVIGFDDTRGVYMVTDEGGNGHTEEVGADEHGTFPIGGGSWCWTLNEPTRRDAAAHVAEIFAECDLADSLGNMLSCIEAEAVAGLLRAHGHDDGARILMDAHASQDDGGDHH